MKSPKSTTLWVVVTLDLILFLNFCCSSPNVRDTVPGGGGDPVRLRILEFDSGSGKLVQVLTSKNSDIIYGEDVSRGGAIVLECRSNYGPVTFSYKGDGSPEYLTNTNTTRNFQSGVNFWSFLSFTRIPKSGDSGNFTCSLVNNPDFQNSVYLYIPDSSNTVFVPSPMTNRLEFPKGDFFRIPCSVVHPMASVSLERISENLLSELGVSDKVTYNPKSGFTIHMSLINPRKPTTFICKGVFGGRMEESTYKIFTEESSMMDSDVETFVTSNFNEDRKRPANGRTGSGLISACTKSTCGKNAECIVIEYRPYCVCHEGFTGDPRKQCFAINNQSQQLIRDPCTASANPCGKNSNCIAINQHPVCSCKENFYGTPPACQAQKPSSCSDHNDCGWGEQCDKRTSTCQNVCSDRNNFCGENSRCFSVAHSPFCECLKGFSGNAYRTKGNKGCKPTSSMLQNKTVEINLCNKTSCGVGGKCQIKDGKVACICPVGFKGNPYEKCISENNTDEIMDRIKVCDACGPNSICTVKNTGQLSCECNPHAVGFPPNCTHVKKVGCRDNFDCAEDLICDRGKCLNPCPFMCSESAICKVIRHSVQCECPSGFEGSPQFGCRPTEIEPEHPCKINCGPNTICRAVKFNELEKYRKTLREGRQEALYFDMIRANRNLQNGKYSECLCRKSFYGNPYSLSGCHPTNNLESQFPVTIVVDPEPCNVSPNPCGQNSFCRSYNRRALCSCDFNSVGHPPNCKLKCQKDSHCLFNESCIKGLCQIAS